VLASSLALVIGCSEGDDNTTIIVEESPDGDGLTLTITSVKIPSDMRPVVDFSLADDDGNPVEVDDLDGNPSFVLGWIDMDPASGLTRYQSHVVRTVNGANFDPGTGSQPPALASATQAGTDQGGELTEKGDGVYEYRFGTVLPAGYDRSATHTLAAYATREDRTFVANAVHNFVPDGSPLMDTREVVSDAACNSCHGTLSAHGGSRRAIGLCIVCHTDQTIDPETGESLDFNVMVHKIHRGHDLTNLPYLIVGRNQNVHDYSTVAFPQDDRNCEKCHTGGADADHWRTDPSRAACGACHDDVDFETGAGHSTGIQQFDDTLCSNCHRETIVVEFDNTVPGAHTIGAKSSLNPHLQLAFTEVTGMTPGGTPQLRFTIADDAGPVAIATLNRVGVAFGGPTTDYSQLLSTGSSFVIQGAGASGTLVENTVGDYTYTPPGTYMIPADATGTWAAGLEARTNAVTAGNESIRFSGNNPIAYVDTTTGTLGTGSPEERRTVVSEVSCGQCHDDLVFHGGQRTEVQYCVLCHNRMATDEARRPGVDPVTNPPSTVDFKVLIHRIHRGTDLTQPYIVYGFGNVPHEFSEVRFPREESDCSTCHVDDSHLLPIPDGLGPTTINIAGVTVPQDGALTAPTAAVCSSCHDSEDANVHVRLNTITNMDGSLEESCNICHGEGKIAAVSEVHSR
jgi:OmcA/MtrC family decaheme c-type cytochrome